MSFNPDTVNRPQLADDIENVRRSAQSVYDAAEGPMTYQKAWDAHQAVLAAFVAKYGSLRIGHLL